VARKNDAEERVSFTAKNFALRDLTIIHKEETSHLPETCDSPSESILNQAGSTDDMPVYFDVPSNQTIDDVVAKSVDMITSRLTRCK
jgi:hypothetical protein